MKTMTRVSTHPGEILKEDYLLPLGISQSDFARKLGISAQRVNEIVNGKRGVTPETAILFGKVFKTSAEFWMNLQSQYDLTAFRSKSKSSRSADRQLLEF